MHKIIKKLISLILAILLSVGSLGLVASVKAADSNTSPDSDSAAAESSSIGISEDSLAADSTYTAEETPVFGSASNKNIGTESLGGTEEIVPQDNMEILSDSDSALHFDEEYVENEIVYQEDTAINAETGENESLGGIAGATISASKDAVIINKDSSAAITLNYSNAPENGKILIGTWHGLFPASNVKCSLTDRGNKTLTLTIQALATGTCSVIVALCNRLYVPYAIARIKVNVCVSSLTTDTDLSSIILKQGAAKTILFTAKGYSGSSEITISTTNDTAYTCSVGAKNGDTVPVVLKGNQIGTGSVTVYYKADLTGDVLQKVTFSVSVLPNSRATLSVASANIALYTGQSQGITITYGNYSGSVYFAYYSTNRSAFSCEWSGAWVGNSQTLTITGTGGGTGRITVYLYTSGGIPLTTATIFVSVRKDTTPSLTASTTFLNLDTGSSGSVAYTLTNCSSMSTAVGCTNSNPNICRYAWNNNGNHYTLTVAGKNAGTAVLQIWVKDAAGNILASSKLTVTVKAKLPPKLSVSRTSARLSVKDTQTFYFSYANCLEPVKLSYSNSASNVCSATWSAWSGNSISMTVTGNEPGTIIIIVRLLRASDLAVLDSLQVSVTVDAKPSDIPISNLSYPFHNFNAKSLSACVYMYGNNQIAQNVCDWLGYGGQCFGMATSAGLLYGHTVSVGSFNTGKNKVSQLSMADRSGSLGLTVSDFIEAMHASQAATTLFSTEGVNETANAIISEIGAGRIIFVGIRGDYPDTDKNGKSIIATWGHRVLAYDYSLTGNKLTVSIYDSNDPMVPQTLTFSRNSAASPYTTWSYTANGIHWGTGEKNAVVRYTTYANIESVWQLGKQGKLFSEIKDSQDKNIILTNESNFTLYSYNYDTKESTAIAKYQNGTLSEKAENVEAGSIPKEVGAESDGLNILVVPADYYFVEDDSPEDGISMSIVSELLSVKVETDTDSFGFCADETSNEASASITPGTGEKYQITIGSSRQENPGTMSIEGVGSGRAVNMNLAQGNLSLGDDADSAALTVEPSVELYSVSAEAETGGKITPAGSTEYAAGENVLYSISADDGYSIGDVLVDGQSVGRVTSWYFENISESHTITATFVQNISACAIQVSSDNVSYNGEQLMPSVTVTDKNGTVLEENVDYQTAYNDNVQSGTAKVVVMALPGSVYAGTAETSFTIQGPVIQNAIVQQGKLNVTLSDAAFESDSVIYASVYDGNGKLLEVFSKALGTEANPATFDLSNIVVPGRYKVKIFLVSNASFSPKTPDFTTSYVVN
jgi:hypothetical protein